MSKQDVRGVWMIAGPPRLVGSQDKCWNYEFQAGCILPPLEPVLTLLRDNLLRLSEAQRKKALVKARFYPPHRSFFEDWLYNPLVVRQDLVPFYPAEYRFEQDIWFSSLARLIDLVSPEGFQWRLANIQYAAPGLVKLIQAFHQRKNSNLTIVLFITAYRNWNLPKTKDPWFSLVEELDKSGRYVRTTSVVLKHESQNLTPLSNPKGFFRDALRFHCYEDALGAGASLADEYPGLWGELLLIKDDPDNAAVYLQDAWESTQQGRRTLEDIRIGLAYCRLLGTKKDMTACKRVMSLVSAEVKRLGDPGLELETELHELYLEILMNWSYEAGGNYDRLRARYQAMGWTNTVSYLDSLMSIYTFWIQKDRWSEAVDYALGALKRCEHQGNLFRVSVMFHVLGYIHEYKGDPQKSLPFFQKSIALRQKLGETTELIKVLNGTGYFCFSIGWFSHALNYYSQALKLLKDAHDLTESCLTIFNIAVITVFSGLHEDALFILEDLLEIMDILGLEFLPWHRKSKIQALAACAAHHSGRTALAFEYLESIRDADLDEEAGPYVYMVRGTLGHGEEWFDKALATAGSTNQKHLPLRIQVERILWRASRDLSFDRTQSLKTLLDGKEKDYQDFEIRWIFSLLEPDKGSGVPRISRRTLDLISGHLSAALQEAANTRFRQKIREINFLKVFQTAVTENLDVKAFYETVRTFLRQQFSIPALSFKTIPAGTPLKNSQALTADFPLDNGEVLRLIAEHKSGQNFSPEDQRIFELARAHMVLVWNLRKAREELEHAASLDPLTGAYTRREILERLEAERRRTLRYRRAPDQGFTLLFLDLDFFKSYNDVLGHQGGDLVLSLFCNLVRDQIRDVDLLGRYGGDEFLVLLPETGPEGGRQTAGRILQALKNAQGFIPQLMPRFEKAADFPRDKYLGCSIGGATFTIGAPVEIDELIKQADNRLYQAKKDGKNRLVDL